MKRWKFIGLISLMVISLLGIIWVQLVWINNALAVRNDLFNRSVYQSLHSTARRIESARNINFFEQMMLADSMLQAQASEIMTNPFSQSYNVIPRDLITGDSNQSITTSESFSIRISGDRDGVILSGGVETQFSNDSLRYISRHEIPGMTFSPGTDSEGNVVIGEDRFQNWVQKKSEELRNMGDQMINEIYNWEVNTGADAELIYSTLKSELANSGIFTPFEFAVIENGRVINRRSSEFTDKDFMSSNYSVGLFPNRLIDTNTRLSLKFPERNNYIFGSMALILGASSVFSLIIMVTFALSIFFIIRQKKISEMKSDFINNMTHEFKTPIATISLAADTIANPKIIGDESRVKHFIAMIKKENVRMNKQVENILQISTLDKSEMEFVFEEVDINSVVQRSIETIEIQVNERGGNIFFFPEAEDYVITGDVEHLINLVHNLLDNANKYSPEAPDITVRTESTDSGIKLTVEDRGMGMNKNVQSKIFEKFYRQSGGNVHNVKGFGLGLSYVKAIVEAHNGRIFVSSEPGKGSRFEVYLPGKQ
jgi:two-component system phosphate regulon sensor histidine kinase PhoR